MSTATTEDARSLSRDIDVVVITLEANSTPRALRDLRVQFPQARAVRACDLRGTSVRTLFERGLVTPGALFGLVEGRRRHSEIGAAGAVGLRESMREALASGPVEVATLCCEEDVVPHSSLAAEVRRLLASASAGDFDLAIFGPLKVIESATMRAIGQRSQPLPRSEAACAFGAPAPHGWEWLDGIFYGTHCVLWSPQGKAKAARFLSDRMDMQVDSLFSIYHALGMWRCLVQTSQPPLATQAMHLSSVQTNLGADCTLCDVAPAKILRLWLSSIFVMLLLAAFGVYLAWRRSCPANDPH